MFKKMAQRYIHARLHPSKVQAALEKITTLEQTNPVPNQHPNRVTCVQREIKPVKKVDEFVYAMYSIVKNSVANGSSYIIFPEYNFFDLFWGHPRICNDE